MKSNILPTDTTPEITACSICGSKNVLELIHLPGLPLTDTFCTEPVKNPPRGIDQSFLFCSECRHGQVSRVLDTHTLYGDQYHFRSSKSDTSRKGTEFFVDYLLKTFPGKTFSSILDVGCNDLHLLKSLKAVSVKRCGIDPIWAGVEGSPIDDAITVFGKPIEALTCHELRALSPDLVVCRHSLEHIQNPMAVLQKLLAESPNNSVFLFEVPALEVLVRKQRFDQIFHQHLHYFSLTSFLRLIEEAGGRYLSHTWNYHDWGALLVAFKKGGPSSDDTHPPALVSAKMIEKSYRYFQRQFQITGELLDHFKDQLMYGYGAAQMLPVIAYHLNNDLSCLECILDDDPHKDGLQYANLPVRIRHPRKAGDMKEAIVFITAIDNLTPILKNLFKLSPKDIMYPLHIF